MAPRLFFTDNTVLISFAIIGHLSILQSILNGNGTWAASVESECVKSAQRTGLGSLASVRQILGAPIIPNAAELTHTRTLRDLLATPGDNKYQHLGEAESMAIIELRHPSSLLVTDDEGARRLAQNRGITVIRTLQLLRIAFKKQLITDTQLFEALRLLRKEGRQAPYVADATDARQWVRLCDERNAQ